MWPPPPLLQSCVRLRSLHFVLAYEHYSGKHIPLTPAVHNYSCRSCTSRPLLGSAQRLWSLHFEYDV